MKPPKYIVPLNIIGCMLVRYNLFSTKRLTFVVQRLKDGMETVKIDRMHPCDSNI